MTSTGLNSSVQAADIATSKADVVVALTSYNDAGTISAVASALRAGSTRYLASNAVRFVLADAGSTDGTPEAVREVVDPIELLEVAHEGGTTGKLAYHGYPARAAALRAILQTAHRLGAKACAVVDAGLQSVEPEWIERLIAPVLTDGIDYASPYYLLSVNEGAITRSIVYPMFRALYGVRLRQPAASEFGCSGRLMAYYLEQDFWDIERAQVGIDLWLAIAAACGEFRIGEAAFEIGRASCRERV